MAICAFCGKAAPEVFVMIQGPGVAICDECVDVSVGLIKEQREKSMTELEKAREAYRQALRNQAEMAKGSVDGAVDARVDLDTAWLAFSETARLDSPMHADWRAARDEQRDLLERIAIAVESIEAKIRDR